MSRRLMNSGVITDDVHRFLAQFHENVSRGKFRLRSSYTAFQKITKETYAASLWPDDSDVIRKLGLKTSDESTLVFIYLYRELYYRHAFKRCYTEDFRYESMHDSFKNYINLFNKLLDYYDEGKKFAEIPDVWLWDMIESFVGQFQYYHHWQSDPENNYSNLATILSYKHSKQQKKIQEKWDVQVVLRYLHYFVQAAKLPIKYNEPVDIVQLERQNPMMRMLGIFSCIGLCRIHCILGDYRTAIDVMDPVDKVSWKYILTVYFYHIIECKDLLWI